MNSISARTTTKKHGFGLVVKLERVQFQEHDHQPAQEYRGNELIAHAKVASLEAGSRHVFTLGVEDVDVTSAELSKRGVKWLNGPMDRP